MYQNIDSLPTGPEWSSYIITCTGNKLGQNGVPLSEDVELWARNPVECIKQLIGNPEFKDDLAYRAQHVFADKEVKNRMYDEAWTGDFWYETQVSTGVDLHL